MLDHTENQQLHELIVHVAPLLPGPSSPLSSSEPAATPFSASKIERILDRVYNRLADEAVESADPRLRELIAEAVSPNRSVCPPFSTGKVRRILDRVRSRLAADTVIEPVRVESPARPGPKATLWSGLRAAAVALFSPRQIPASAQAKLSSGRGAEPLLEGPRAD